MERNTPGSPGVALRAAGCGRRTANSVGVCQTALTRRQLLRYAALVGATFPVASAIDKGWLLSAHAGTGFGSPPNIELGPVTDTEAVITWFTGDPTQPDKFGRPLPVAAPGRVLIGTSPDPRSWRPVGEHAAPPSHYGEILRLAPGRSYYWRAESAGQPASFTVTPRTDPASAAPPAFTTMVPPPGREIGRVAWMNDLHYGEKVAGLAYSNSSLPRGGLPPGFPVD